MAQIIYNPVEKRCNGFLSISLNGSQQWFDIEIFFYLPWAVGQCDMSNILESLM